MKADKETHGYIYGLMMWGDEELEIDGGIEGEQRDGVRVTFSTMDSSALQLSVVGLPSTGQGQTAGEGIRGYEV
ncbi:hypothetical protein EYF80_017397 [Liparis tanakae]|uniref:Uncharacterized protein n=1 Tax=Liparis tanakae TaxID=230148 RepID=A0A4Z2I356_9TELE|nr:hypothetical protein EYF80_017397 [Liparis tanakae]